MRFALDLTIFGDLSDPGLLVDLGVEAEAAGWDGFFLWDHMVAADGGPVTDPWMVFAALAVRTEQLRFGPMVTPLARRRMTKLARETVALDQLSSGRLVMGVGLGEHDAREFEAFGDEADRKTRAQVLDESLKVLTGLWSGRPFSFVGEHLVADTTGFQPTAVQRPRIPVWVAGLWPYKRPMRRAAAWDGVFPIKAGGGFTYQMSPEEMAEARAFVAEERVSTEPFDLVHAGLLSGDPVADAELAHHYEDVGVTWWLEHVYPGRMSPAQLRDFIRSGPPHTG